jgi:hypothetical protein
VGEVDSGVHMTVQRDHRPGPEWPHGWTLAEIDTAAVAVTVTRRPVPPDAAAEVNTVLAPPRTFWRHDGATWRRADSQGPLGQAAS